MPIMSPMSPMELFMALPVGLEPAAVVPVGMPMFMMADFEVEATPFGFETGDGRDLVCALDEMRRESKKA